MLRRSSGIALAALLALTGALDASSVAAAPPNGQRSARASGARRSEPATKKRYISSQAYYHAMRAELALAQGSLPLAADELQLALVYDPDSLYLTLELLRISLEVDRPDRATRLGRRAVELAPRNAAAHLGSARAHQASNRPNDAERALRRAVELDDASIDAPLELARLLERQGRVKPAKEVLSRAADRIPQATAPLAELARLATEAFQLRRAIDALERAVRRDPRDVDLVRRLADLYERMARPQDAAAAWATAVDAVPGDPEALLGAARAAFSIGEDEAGQRHVERAQAVSGSIDLEHHIGLVYLATGRHDDAARVLTTVAAARSGDDGVWIALALAQYHRGEDAAALAALERVGPESSKYGEARSRLVHVLLGMGRPERAEMAASVAVSKRPDDPQLLALSALVMERRGRSDRALATVRDARKRSPADPDLLAREVQLLERSGAAGEADSLVERAIAAESDPLRLAELLFAAAELAQGRGDLARASEVLQRIMKLEPRGARAPNFFGYLWANKGERLPEAERAIRRALALSPSSAAVMDSLGWVRFRQGDAAGALPWLIRASRMVPRDAEVAEHLGDVWMALGKPEDARAAYERADQALADAERAREPGATESRRRVAGKITAPKPGP